MDQIRNVAQLVVEEVFGSAPSTSALAIQLAEVPDEVWTLITHGLFYGASGVLTLVATYHPDLDFAAIYSGYADGRSTEDIQMLGESLLPHARLVAEQVSAQWVVEARHSSMAKGVGQEDVMQPADRVGAGLKVSVIPPSTVPNVVPLGGEQPLSSSTVPSADAVGRSR